MSALRELDKAINEQTHSKEDWKKPVFVERELWRRGLDEMIPVYRRDFGCTHLAHQGCEFDNYVYRGRAICFKPDGKA